ncbi:hypothetical protein A9174_19745 [Mesorhizobium loti NZP2037]|nr:DUF4118 domain-containing protein [Mesorhizobium loti]ANN58758.1 hypothetical protein A9174_19745 [Mesorhizobium loti NZP2037]
MADATSNSRRDSPLLSDADPLSDSAMSEGTALLRYLASFAMTAVATAVAVGVDTQVAIPNISLVFVVPVIMAAITLGLGPSLSSAILGALAYNFFLTEPRYTLIVDDPANVWAIGLLFLIGLIVSGVAFTSHRRAADAALLRRQVTVLQNYSRDVVAADNTKAIISVTTRALGQLFQVPVVVILVAEGKAVSIEKDGDIEPQEAEIEEALSSLATGLFSPAGVYPALASRFDFWPVAIAEGRGAAIGLAFRRYERPSAPSTVVDIVSRLLGMALDRHHLAD